MAKGESQKAETGMLDDKLGKRVPQELKMQVGGASQVR